MVRGWRGEASALGRAIGSKQTPAISFSSGEVDSGRKMGAGGMNPAAMGAALFLFGVGRERGLLEI